MELSVHGRGAPVRATLSKRITSIGAAVDADLRVDGLPPYWATVHLAGDAAELRVLGSGAVVPLTPGRRQTVAGVAVELERTGAGAQPALERLADRLADADDTDAALAVIIDGVIAMSRGDLGAIILAERGGFTVAAARDAAGRPVADAAELLSDTIVRDVLGSGEGVLLDDLAGTPYSQVRSVVKLGLSSVVCLPLRLGGRNLGALFVAATARPLVLPERVLADLKILAALALPFVAQLRRRSADAPAGTDAIVGTSPPMVAVRDLVARVGPTELSTLLRGPSGSGKEVVARALHARSPRAGRPLIAINCAAIAPALLDSELFGYRKGAFTGALADRAGLIEAAAGGTLFLDEIGDMPLAMQAALLRVLEQREVRRLGDVEPRPVDFRLIAATHRDLTAEVAAERFREDLFFRIQEVTIAVPPLAARGDDILLLAAVFLRQVEVQLGLAHHTLGAAAEAQLRAHPWPGNVRELKATMRRAAILADGPVIGPAHLQLPAAPAPALATDAPAVGATNAGDLAGLPLTEARDAFVKRYVEAALARHGGNREAAARELGIGVRTIYRYIE